MDRETWCAAVHVVTKSWTWLSDWTELKYVKVQTPLHSVRVLSNSLWSHELQHARVPVLHHLLELTQIHVHWVGDATQPSHPLSPPSPPALFFSIRVFSSELALHIRLVPMNVPSFGNTVFAGIQVHMRSLKWSLNPLQLFPYKKNVMFIGRIPYEDRSFTATTKELPEAKKLSKNSSFSSSFRGSVALISYF